MSTETFYVFREDARGRSWLKRFEEKGILHGFIPQDRYSVLHIRRLLDQYQPLIFHSHFVSYDIATLILKLVFYRHSKVIWHLHSPGRLTLRQRGKDIIKVRVLARSFVDRFIAVAEGTFDNARARGFSKKKLVLIPNCIDVSRFRPNSGMRRRVRESLGIGEDQLVYLLLGWDPHRKGVDLFTKAANLVATSANRPDLFLIIGQRATRDFVRNLPESGALGSSLRVIDPLEDFPPFLNAVDIVVSPSRAEGLPYAVLEGMAAGKLILSSDIPGAREAYGGSRGVWLFPTEDWMLQATYMTKARALSITERQGLGEANSKYVAEHYSLPGWAEKVGNLYESLLR
jgi:glycosyltransferase involved in cell wall biosynthesis